MKLILFEDLGYRDLLPLTYFRPVWDLRCGALTLAEKTAFLSKSPLYGLSRTYLMKSFQNNVRAFDTVGDDETALFLNGRWLPDAGSIKKIDQLSPGQTIVYEDSALAFCATIGEAKQVLSDDGTVDVARLAERFQPLSHETIMSGKPMLFRYPWDLIRLNAEQIAMDAKNCAQLGTIAGTLHAGVHILAPENVSIAKGVTIQPGVVINAENGPVWIDEDATVMANSVLVGPLYVGKKSTIKIAAKIYENTSIGPVCKVGGEVEGCIIHGYSNKQHDGFLGHAYLAEWVNLGADTNNSDLKNNYGSVTVNINGHPVNTGERFVGLIMGDHSKCAINTMFNTGTVVGACCNIFGAGMPPKFVPSFSWGGAEELVAYKFEKAMAVAKIVMERRNVKFTAETATVFETVQHLAKEIESGTLL